jgi:hypothetical protein
VCRIDVHRAQQAHFLRQALELEIVRMLALKPDEALVAELHATIARQQQFAKAGAFETFMAADNEFHAQLYQAADKQDIWALVRSRSGHIDRLRRLHLPSPGKAQDIVRHHKLIAKAIAGGEPEEAQKHLRTHLSGTLSELAQPRAASGIFNDETARRRCAPLAVDLRSRPVNGLTLCVARPAGALLLSCGVNRYRRRIQPERLRPPLTPPGTAFLPAPQARTKGNGAERDMTLTTRLAIAMILSSRSRYPRSDGWAIAPSRRKSCRACSIAPKPILA